MHLAKLVAVLAMIGTGFLAAAQETSELSTGDLDQRTLEIQQKVDRLFDRGEYERSFFIYRHELVPLGDKYAQYMVGYMYETGIGTHRDPILASAWYRLAAERGTPEFVAVRNQLMRGFSAEDEAGSDAAFRDLREQYGDLVVLLELIRRDVRELRNRTGSRVGSGASPVAVIDSRSGSIRSGGGYFESVRDRLEERLGKLVELGDLRDVEVDADAVDIDELERAVERAMLRPEY